MADLNWSDVVNNPQAYPDEMLVRDLGEEVGQQLVALRQAVVPRTVAQRQMQRAEVLSEEKRVLEQQLAQALTGQGGTDPNAGRSPYPIDYNSDPLLGPLHRDSLRALEIAEASNKRLDDITKLQHQLLQGLSGIPVAMRLEQLKQHDPQLDTQRLLDFQREKLKQPDLADAYKLYTYEQQMAKARETGMAEGLEKAKTDLQLQPAVPYAPYGPPQSIPLPQPQFSTMEQAESAALQDPEIIGSFYSHVS